MATRAILLDALGTLVALEPPVAPLVSLLRSRHGIDVTTDDARRALRIEMTHYRERCGRAADAPSLEALRLECSVLLGRELGGAAAALAAPELLPTLLDSIRFHAYPEVAGTLRQWRDAGLRLVVASNWDISLHDVLRGLGLRELLDGAVTSAEVGAAKPAPALFEAALALAGVGPREAVHVGDSLLEDVEGARAAGIDAVLLARDTASPPPPGVRVIATLGELELAA